MCYCERFVTASYRRVCEQSMMNEQNQRRNESEDNRCAIGLSSYPLSENEYGLRFFFVLHYWYLCMQQTTSPYSNNNEEGKRAQVGICQNDMEAVSEFHSWGLSCMELFDMSLWNHYLTRTDLLEFLTESTLELPRSPLNFKSPSHADIECGFHKVQNFPAHPRCLCIDVFRGNSKDVFWCKLHSCI